MNDKNIQPIHNGQYHGYQQWYYTNNDILFRGVMKYNNLIKYIEYHSKLIKETIYYIK